MRIAALSALLLSAAWPVSAGAWGQDSKSADQIVVYLIDHQFLPLEELSTIKAEVEAIFGDAGLKISWIADMSPRRRLHRNELRVIILPSDGTNWFHGPSNIIGIAPHDDRGIGRNCFVFYRQAIWFRQQAVSRCREAVQARTEAATRGVEIDPYIDSMAPYDCGDRLPSLTALIVARTAAHEMVHILLNKLDHSPHGLMRNAFDIGDLWMVDGRASFRLGRNELTALHTISATGSH
ncbi:MAG: hypothetical protein ACE5HV_07800 [Acidobacteriota bacterium]